MAHAERRRDQRMAARLLRKTRLRIHQNEREVGGGSAGRHVARVLLMAGRIGDDELALLGGKETIGKIDGDLLLALGGEPVEQQREVEVFLCAGQLAAILAQRLDLVVEHELCFKQQTPQQARLAVIDRTAGDEAQQALGFVIVNDGVAFEHSRISEHIHQK